MKAEIKYIKTDELIPYALNSRTHSEEQISQISASIREFGFTNPILVDDEMTIIAGHGRLQAAKRLKMKEVPCIALGHLTETQKKAYVIADNKLALNSGWDLDLLNVELQDLLDVDYDVNLIGFSEDELKNIIIDAVESDLPELSTGEKEPFQQMTFTLHDLQIEEVKSALDKSKKMGEFAESYNENSNANALVRICEEFNRVKS
jgi:ParB family transcriptional regulator, chromosome partitioning protein